MLICFVLKKRHILSCLRLVRFYLVFIWLLMLPQKNCLRRWIYKLKQIGSILHREASPQRMVFKSVSFKDHSACLKERARFTNAETHKPKKLLVFFFNFNLYLIIQKRCFDHHIKTEHNWLIRCCYGGSLGELKWRAKLFFIKKHLRRQHILTFIPRSR